MFYKVLVLDTILVVIEYKKIFKIVLLGLAIFACLNFLLYVLGWWLELLAWLFFR